jgi:hypothetical protein
VFLSDVLSGAIAKATLVNKGYRSWPDFSGNHIIEVSEKHLQLGKKNVHLLSKQASEELSTLKRD